MLVLCEVGFLHKLTHQFLHITFSVTINPVTTSKLHLGLFIFTKHVVRLAVQAYENQFTSAVNWNASLEAKAGPGIQVCSKFDLVNMVVWWL